MNTLNGQTMYEAYLQLTPSTRSWEALGEVGQNGYNELAHILSAQLLLCESCGTQQQTRATLHEVAGMVLCSDCISPPTQEEQQQWRSEQDKLIRLAHAQLRKARDEQLHDQGPKGAA